MWVLAWMAAAACHRPQPTPAAGFVDIGAGSYADAPWCGPSVEFACGSLLELEPKALMGALDRHERQCLEGAHSTLEPVTARHAVARVLMADAWARDDLLAWLGIAREAFDDAPEPDADLAFALAHVTASHGGDPRETLRYADLALAGRGAWAGETQRRRVERLESLRRAAITSEVGGVESESGAERP